MKDSTKSLLLTACVFVGRLLGYALIALSVSFGGIAGIRLATGPAPSASVPFEIKPCEAQATKIELPPDVKGEDDRILFGRVRGWAREAAQQRLAESLQEANDLATPESIVGIVTGTTKQGTLGAFLLSIIVKVVAAALAAMLLTVLWQVIKPYVLGALIACALWVLFWAGLLDCFWAFIGLIRRKASI